MKQNIYDNPDFFNGYKSKRDKKSGVNDFVEQPAMLSMLPDLKGKDILDLGCGAGDMCRRIKNLGARSVIGVDISSKMIELAKQDIVEGIEYLVSAIEDYFPVDKEYDLVISSLAVHYIENLEDTYKRIYSLLKPDGIFLFSTEHPVITCSRSGPGWHKDAKGNKLHWKVDDYEDEGKRSTFWIVDNVIKYHRKISTHINTLIHAGFTILQIEEPVASQEDEKRAPDMLEERRRPPFVIIKAGRGVL